MTKSTEPSEAAPLVRIEPEHRVVVLARTIQARDAGTHIAREEAASDQARLGDTCLGRSLYRHHSVFRNASDVPAWSHLELTYFRDVVPADVIRQFVLPGDPGLLRAEILLTTPSSFVLPRDWRGSADRPERKASLEYIHVQRAALGRYRNIMRDDIGPAAAKLVRDGRIGTFRSMETAAVLHHAPELNIDWNQIHLCELDPSGFRGFGPLLDDALREISPGRSFARMFEDLERIRSIPRWTFNDAVFEADVALLREGISGA